MTRVAFISDIHGNLHALQAVIRRIRSMRIRQIVCLGDVVGYGPHPAECLDLVMKHCEHVVRGNHDEAVLDGSTATDFNGAARAALDWTCKVLQPRHVELLTLMPGILYLNDDIMCVHDSPIPGPTDYVMSPQIAARAFRGVDTRVCMVGHTHVPMTFEAPTPHVEDHLSASDVTAHIGRDGESIEMSRQRRYICNPGSVGQPRDCDPRASFGVLDTRRWTFSIHREAYDVEAVQEATESAGLPTALADRLAIGA